MLGYLALATALALNATANILLKIGATKVQGIELSFGWIVQHWIIWVGLACFALNVGFYAVALSKLPLSVAYPVMAVGGMALIILVSSLYLKETITSGQILGFALVTLGLFLVVGKQT